MKTQIEEMAARVATAMPGTTYEVDAWSSGIVHVDFRRANEFVVMRYDPSTGFGADNLADGRDDDFFSWHYTPAGKTIEEAEQRVKELLAPRHRP